MIISKKFEFFFFELFSFGPAMNLRYTYVRKTKGIVLEYSYLYTAVFNTVSQQSSYSKKWVPEERQGLQQSFISTLAVNSLFPKPCQVARGLVVCWISWHAWPPPSNFSCRKSTFHFSWLCLICSFHQDWNCIFVDSVIILVIHQHRLWL